jgi:hypothetical protein
MSEKADFSLNERERFSQFVSELADLSIKYGVVIRAVGGVAIFEEGELQEVTYDNDITSGDLISEFICQNNRS